MIPLITKVIPKQNFELVHDRIGEILTIELDNQAIIGYDPDLEVDIYKERSVPFQPAELPSVNVMISHAIYDRQTQVHSDGVVRYLIECTFNAESTDADDENDRRGDTISMAKCQHLLGVIRAILEDPKYKTLAFPAPFIERRWVEDMYFMKRPIQDANTTSQGRLTFAVRFPEYPVELAKTYLLESNETTVKLEQTDKGYMWIRLGYQ